MSLPGGDPPSALRRSNRRPAIASGSGTLLLAALGLLFGAGARGWGDEGHEVIALIAVAELAPPVARDIEAMLAGDPTGLTMTDVAHEATWADHFRDSDRDGARLHYLATREWHFVDLELEHPSLESACHGRPALAPDVPASLGPADDCIVDKIEQFEHELQARSTAPAERRLALQFLLHLVGDLHQPLHAADDHDAGGNRRWVSLPGERSVPLHHVWDTVAVERLGANPVELAHRLQAGVTAEERAHWARGTPEQWALESFAIARTVAYGALPERRGRHHDHLPPRYLEVASETTALQLQKAGVRLAWLLNEVWRKRGSEP